MSTRRGLQPLSANRAQQVVNSPALKSAHKPALKSELLAQSALEKRAAPAVTTPPSRVLFGGAKGPRAARRQGADFEVEIFESKRPSIVPPAKLDAAPTPSTATVGAVAMPSTRNEAPASSLAGSTVSVAEKARMELLHEVKLKHRASLQPGGAPISLEDAAMSAASAAAEAAEAAEAALRVAKVEAAADKERAIALVVAQKDQERDRLTAELVASTSQMQAAVARAEKEPAANKAAVTEQRQPQQQNLNQATVEDLIEIPGIGQKLAQQIVNDRRSGGNFASVEDAGTRICGLGASKVKLIRMWFPLCE